MKSSKPLQSRPGEIILAGIVGFEPGGRASIHYNEMLGFEKIRRADESQFH